MRLSSRPAATPIKVLVHDQTVELARARALVWLERTS